MKSSNKYPLMKKTSQPQFNSTTNELARKTTRSMTLKPTKEKPTLVSQFSKAEFKEIIKMPTTTDSNNDETRAVSMPSMTDFPSSGGLQIKVIARFRPLNRTELVKYFNNL
jgi:hypothetical protein